MIHYTKGRSLRCPDPNSIFSQQPCHRCTFPFLEYLSPSVYDFFLVSSTSSLVINYRPLESCQVFSCYSPHDEDLTSQLYDSARSRKTAHVSFVPLPGSLPAAGAQAWVHPALPAQQPGTSASLCHAWQQRWGEKVHGGKAQRSKMYVKSGAQSLCTDLFLHPRCSRHSVRYL